MPGSESTISVTQHAGENDQRHKTFYLSGQSTVFKVEGKLFKVDPTLFTGGEDSVLKTMLSLPQGNEPSCEGTSDACPIILHGDTAAQFEALLWGLHSKELFKAHISVDDVDRYVQLVKIAHKYDMQGLEAWATSGLARLAQSNMLIPETQAVLLLDVFCLCSCTNAKSLMLNIVKAKLSAGACSTKAITSVINIGQRYDLPGLTSRGYYAMMLKPKVDWEWEHTFSWRDRYRLLNGHYALCEYSLDGSIKSLEEKFTKCHPTWGPVWKTYATQSKEEEIRRLNNIRLVDIASRLTQLVESFLKDTPLKTALGDMHPALLRNHLSCVINDLFETKFPMYFVDPAEQTVNSKQGAFFSTRSIPTLSLTRNCSAMS